MAEIIFTLEDANGLYKLPQIDKLMPRTAKIMSREWDIPAVVGHSLNYERLYIDRDLRRWQWLGQQVDCKRFLIHGEMTIMALTAALKTLDGHDAQQVRTRLRMVNKDDAPYEHAAALAKAAVEYSVKLQYGPSGLVAWRRHMEKQIKCCRLNRERILRAPADLEMAPYLDDIVMRNFIASKMVLVQ